MNKAGRASWQITTDQPASLVIGLFIRDVAGVPSRHSWLPPASPAIPRAGEQAPDAAGQQWDDWWNQAMQEERHKDGADWPPDPGSWWTPPDFESLHAAPELQAIVAGHFFDAVRWSSARHREHGATMRSSVRGLFATNLFRELERDRAPTAAPFHLRISEIPVQGQQLWQLHPDHVLVTADLLRDTTQYQQRLTPVMKALFTR